MSPVAAPAVPAAPPVPSGPSAADRRRRGSDSLALWVLCTVQLLLVLDVSIVNVGLRTLQHDLDVSTTALPWIVSVYALTYGGLLLLGGRLGDLLGRRRTLRFGVLVFGLSSLVAGLASSATAVLAARAVQGVGSALAAPAVLGLMVTTFPDPVRRARAMGVYAAMSGAGAALGLAGGGLLVQELSWRAVFLLNVPVVAAVLVLLPRVLTETARHRNGLGAPGAVAATCAAAALSAGLSRAGSNGWHDDAALLALTLAAVMAVVLVQVERRSSRPLVPRALLTDRQRLVALLLAAVVGATLLSLLFLTTQLRQGVHGSGAVATGLGFLPFSAAMVTVSQLVARGRWRPRAGMPTGLLLAAVAAVWLATQDSHTGYAAGILGPLLIAGTGVGLVFVPLTVTVTTGVDPRDAGTAGGLLNTCQVLGGALGVAATTTLLPHHPVTAAVAVAAYDRAFAGLAGLLAVAALLSTAGRRRR